LQIKAEKKELERHQELQPRVKRKIDFPDDDFNNCSEYDRKKWSQRTIRPKITEIITKSNMCDLVDATSICALRHLPIDTQFYLTTDPANWNDNEIHHRFKRSIDPLSVVNDFAERSIKLISDLSSSPLTRDEEKLQRLVQVEEHNRKKLPKVTNSAIESLKL
jgi:hypothetical protein